MNYKNFIPMAGYKNKANSNPIKPNQTQFQKIPKMNVNNYYTKDYNNKTAFGRIKNKPKQTQFQSQSNPVLPAGIICLIWAY
jgi:hypothetical protein